MIEKYHKKKKRKKHKASILHRRDGTCFLCTMHGDYRYHKVLHEHHIFGGANRPISEAEGLKVYLCIPHHVDGPKAVHNNADTMRLLRQIGQREYEKTHTREEFMEKFGKNYLQGGEHETDANIENERNEQSAAHPAWSYVLDGLEA